MARPSHVRDALRSLVLTSRRHDWSLDTLVTRLHRDGVAADASSVFRGLIRLEEERVVTRVEAGDGRTRYEARREHHEHVRCEKCGAISEFPGCLVADAIRAVQKRTGYVVSGHNLSFVGLCRSCQ